jgi:hypothetical protein
MSLRELLPFPLTIDTVAIAGSCLWALALYLSFATVRNWLIEKLTNWFNFAERSLYFSTEEFERTRLARESQNAFYASLFSIFPFLAIGALCNWGITLGLGNSWSISLGILSCMASGIYDLGRRSSEQ